MSAEAHRFTRDAGTLLPTVRDVLRLEVVAAALPEVLAGERALDAPVRWVHVTETVAAAALLNGGELVLSTGVGWPGSADALADYAAELARVGVVGIVLELQERYRAAPPPLVAACRRLGLPLIALHRQARFVAITEAVHSRIISEHSLALQARDDVHALFTELGLRGSPADFIVAELGAALRCPVVLEDLAHRVVAAEGDGVDDGVLANWERRSRTAIRTRSSGSEDGWLVRPVEARGTRWGRLIALPGEPHPAGRATVLEQGAVALALSRLSDPGEHEWTSLAHRRLIQMLTGGRFRSEASVEARFEAAGFPVRGRRLAGLAARGDALLFGGPFASEAAHELGAVAVAAPQPDRESAPLLIVLSLPESLPLDDALLGRFAASCVRTSGSDPADLALVYGAEARDLPGLVASLDGATELLRRRGGARHRGPAVHRVEDRPLLRFVSSLGADPRVQEHTERMLGPLLDHDAATGGDLVEVLAAYAAHPGNRTRAAASSHLSRSVFYRRIELVEQLLGVDLSDGEVVSALHVALLARGR